LSIVCVTTAAQASSDLLQLDVSGKISSDAGGSNKNYHFSRTDLLALPVYSIQTSTNWTNSELWEGPRLTDILKKAGISGSTIRVMAYDDFTQEIPVSFIQQYQPILAYRENGRELRLDDFGPLFIIFPRDRFPDVLGTIRNTRRFVFQVRSIEVK
jgi:hypothetical protein